MKKVSKFDGSVQMKGEMWMMTNKLAELVLFVAEKSKSDPAFSATKLNKILFLADFLHYGITGKPITGARYVHRQNGPAPADMLDVIRLLVEAGRAQMEESTYFGYTQKRIVPCVGPDTSIFSEKELELVESVIEHVRPSNAKELSEWTHTLKPWLLTEEGEELPYASVFVLSSLPVERAGIKWAKEELNKLRREEGYAH